MKRTARFLLFLAVAGPSSTVWVTPPATAQAGGAGGGAGRGAGRQQRGRVFTAVGPATEADVTRLREALAKVTGIGNMQVSLTPTGAAIRLGGPAPLADLLAAGKSAGYNLRQMAGYVVAGPNGNADLERLRTVLGQLPGVEAVETRALSGGATLLVYGGAAQPDLTTAAKGAGFTLWSINDGSVREFRMSGATPEALRKLVETLKGTEGVVSAELRTAPDGPRLVLTMGRGRPEGVRDVATAAGVTLTPVDEVVLPSLEPRAGRDTPPDFDQWVMEELTQPGEPAPDFALLAKDGKTTLRLSDSRGKRPVVLMFGSCT